jgi:HPt (histidine-containing phosphotransfer) domain-containing protein
MLDTKAALERLAGDTELYIAVAEAYIEDIPAKLAALNDAINADDLHTLSRVCHSLKGTSSTIGAQACYEIALEGEQLAADEQKTSALQKVEELKNALQRTEEELKNFINKL